MFSLAENRLRKNRFVEKFNRVHAVFSTLGLLALLEQIHWLHASGRSLAAYRSLKPSLP